MKPSKPLGAAAFLCGLLVILIPTAIAPVCEALVETKGGMFVPMRCHYTARTELAIGALLALAGALLFALGRERRAGLALSTLVAALGVVTILVPTVLIGTCGNPTMECNVATRPALVLLGAGILLLGAFGVWQARSRSPQDARGGG
jgi:hypothetical protein